MNHILKPFFNQTFFYLFKLIPKFQAMRNPSEASGNLKMLLIKYLYK